MAARKPGRAGNQSSDAADTPTPEAGADSAAVGGTGARAKTGARRTASAGAGSGTGAAAGAGKTSRAKSTTKAVSETLSAGASEVAGAAKKAATGVRKAAAGAKAKVAAQVSAATEQGGGLQGELRRFVEANPHGWGHGEWEGLLGHLQQQGIDTGDREHIGRELEKEKLAHALESRKVSGLGPSRVRAIAERFGTLYSLQQAGVDEIGSVNGVNRQLAERVHEAVR